MQDGGAWGLLAGQPTDDSEMALALARSICEKGTYDRDAARSAYWAWQDSHPFDMGMTTMCGLTGMSSPKTYWPCDVDALALQLLTLSVDLEGPDPANI